MGYLFLSAALLSGVTKAFCGKKTSGIITGVQDSMMVSFLRMVFCILIGGAVMLAQTGTLTAPAGEGAMLIAVLSGLLTAVFVVSWMLAAKHLPLMLVEIFLTVSVLVTVLLSFFVFGETVSARQIVGLALLPIAVALMCMRGKGSAQKRLSFPALLLLLVSASSSACIDFLQKYYMKTVPSPSASTLQFYAYIFAAVGLLVFFLLAFFVTKREEGSGTRRSVLARSVGLILIMSACLYANSYFKTEAAALLDASKIYPLLQGGSLILNTLMATVAFKEKQTVRSLLGIALAFGSLLLINL